jgi:uncharacterized membrane protein
VSSEASYNPSSQTGSSNRSRTFFVRGLQALLPTLVTVSLILWVWDLLWQQLGRHMIWVIQQVQFQLDGEEAQWSKINRMWTTTSGEPTWWSQVLGVCLSLLLIYIVGLLVGNLIGRTFWKLGESLAMKVPVVRAIYPPVKQVTDFLLQERGSGTFENSRVVACRPHANQIWSIGLVTGPGLRSLAHVTNQEMVTVFIPSSPTAFSGYVMMVPRSEVVELPLKVEEAMRLLISGGVLSVERPKQESDNPQPIIPVEVTKEEPSGTQR